MRSLQTRDKKILESQDYFSHKYSTSCRFSCVCMLKYFNVRQSHHYYSNQETFKTTANRFTDMVLQPHRNFIKKAYCSGHLRWSLLRRLSSTMTLPPDPLHVPSRPAAGTTNPLRIPKNALWVPPENVAGAPKPSSDTLKHSVGIQKKTPSGHIQTRCEYSQNSLTVFSNRGAGIYCQNTL